MWGDLGVLQGSKEGDPVMELVLLPHLLQNNPLGTISTCITCAIALSTSHAYTYDEVQVFVPCTQYGNKSSQKVGSLPIDQSTHHHYSNCHQRDRQQRLGSLRHTLPTSVSWALGGVRGEAHRVYSIWDDRHNVRSQSCPQNCVLFAAGIIT